MRTSLNNIKVIDDYLLGYMQPADVLLFEANMLLSADLTTDVKHQQETQVVIKQYGRKAIRAEIIAAQNKLSADGQNRSFIQSIINLFKKN